MSKKIGWFIPLTLGMLTAFGPFVTDFYLPAMPEMAEFFKTSPSLVALSLTTGMVGLAAGQILIGPLSDKYGRKPMLLLSMVLFVLASIACLFASDIYLFNILRVFQGFGGAGGIVLSKSISTDMFSGKDLAKFMAILGAINGIAPVSAPVVGGLLMKFTTWQGIFIVLLAIGVILLVCSMLLKESLPLNRRSDKNIVRVYGNLFHVFRNPRFTLSTIAMMCCFFTFFAYIASSPFILQTVYQLSPLMYAVVFAVNALVIGVGSGLATLFKHDNTALKCGCIDFMIGAVLVGVCLICHLPLWLLIPSYLWLMLSFGLMQPVSTAIALDAGREYAGSASAIFGASGFVAGAVSSPLVSMGDLRVSAAVVMMGGAFFCLILTLMLCNEVKREALGKTKDKARKNG